MPPGLLEGWFVKKALDHSLNKVKSILGHSQIEEAFEKACAEVIKEEDSPFDKLSVLAIGSPNAIPEKESLFYKLNQIFKSGGFPKEDELSEIIFDSWKTRKNQLDPSEASDFFSTSEDIVRPFLFKVSERFFKNLTQIHKLTSPYHIKKIQENSENLNVLLEKDELEILTQSYYGTELVDPKINEELGILRKSRFFAEFDNVSVTVSFGERLVNGQLSRGTDATRRLGLAWCARLLSRTDEIDKAECYLKFAKSFGVSQETGIACAFLLSQKDDRGTALNTLSKIDTPSSRSAALMIVAYHESGREAIHWLTKAGIEAADLDAEGKYFYLTQKLELGCWNEAKESLNILNAQDFVDAPVLHHVAAITQLLSTVPIEFRSVVLKQVPFESATFPLASDVTSMEARRTALIHFTEGSAAAHNLNCPVAAAVDNEYALWLELMNPETFENGRHRLKICLRDTKSALRLVPLGFQFGVNLDITTVQQEIERQIAFNGGITPDAAIARFALAFMQKTPEAIANYVDQHFDELSKYLDNTSMRFLQIDMLSRAGLLKKANECLDLLLAEELSEVEEGRLRRIISEAEGADPVEARKAQFKKSDSLRDLASLVDELDVRNDWNELCEYRALLFERTRSVCDAERFANALSYTHRSEQLVEFLKANSDLLLQSKKLQMFYSWALYYEGELQEARTELSKLSYERGNPNYRALEINLGIALGDWNFLLVVVANEYMERDKRSAQDLIIVAQLALHLDSPHAKDLIFAAAAKADDDAAVLAAAYFLASSAGWEDHSDVVKWLHKSAELSGDDGPIQKMTLKDIFDSKPDWDRRESETWQLLSSGEIPMFLAAQSLNKSLIDLTLLPALANLSESDPRRRSIIPTYSGKRLPAPLDLAGMIVGIDATVLLTLSFLNLLDKGLDAFDAVHVPHTTLAWLFEEKQKATFHQPSRIRDAHKIRDLLARDILGKFVPSTVADSELSVQVGDELALMISEAEKVKDDDDTQRIVVRSSPVHRLSSLMEEEADLSGHETVMSSCLFVIEKLHEKGQITKEEEKKARAFLQLKEKPWPNQPIISDNAVLYLDELAISYFLHLGILEKLQAAGFRVIPSPGEISKANALIAYEGLSDKVNEAIDRIRSAINSRIESGKIKVDRRRSTDELEGQPILEHPTISIIALASVCDAVISDDRILNQHAYIDDGKERAPIFSTLDILDALSSTGTISSEDLLECRTLLRRAGYFFVPVTDDELVQHLNASVVKDDKVIETAELKAIRENILRVRMSDWLQLPKEAPWLHTILTVLSRVLKRLWTEGAVLSDVTARSNWIVDQIDIRGWAHRLRPEVRDNVVRIGRGVYILMLLSPPFDVSKEIEDGYWGWVEDSLLAPIKEQFPDLYAWIVECHRTQVAKIAETELTDGETT